MKMIDALILKMEMGRWFAGFEPILGTEEEIRARCIALAAESSYGTVVAAIPAICAYAYEGEAADPEAALMALLQRSIKGAGETA